MTPELTESTESCGTLTEQTAPEPSPDPNPSPLPKIFEPALPTPGRIVDFHLPNGESRPAIVVRVHEPAPDEAAHVIDVRVFCAGPDDAEFFNGHHGIEFVQRVPFGQWSWPFRP